MRFIGNAILGGIGGLIVAVVVAIVLTSLGTFADHMPPIPWAVGVVLLFVAGLIGVTRKRYIGLGIVVVWVVGAGFAMMLGQGTDYVTPIHDAVYKAIPWTFVACCAFACVLNALI